MAVSESGFPMFPPESKCWATDEQMLAYQDAIEYGIDARQLEYALTLTPADRVWDGGLYSYRKAIAELRGCSRGRLVLRCRQCGRV